MLSVAKVCILNENSSKLYILAYYYMCICILLLQLICNLLRSYFPFWLRIFHQQFCCLLMQSLFVFCCYGLTSVDTMVAMEELLFFYFTLILLSILHSDAWHRLNIGIDLGNSSLTCFQTRGPKVAKKDVFCAWSIYFLSVIDHFFKEKSLSGNAYR